MDWNLIRSYLMVAEHGSTSTAAHYLEVTQSTISRHLSALEQQLSVQLFDRRKTGLVLTDKGRELLHYAEQMDSIADTLQVRASHYSSSVSGTVRVSGSEVLTTEVLPNCLDVLLSQNPDLQIELLATNDASNLLSREADIALRMFAPQQQDLISKHLMEIPIAFYAHERYIEKQGVPENMGEFATHRFIGFDRNPLFIDGAKQFGLKLGREDFQIRTDSITVQNQCAAAGLGLVIMQERLASRMSGMRKVPMDFTLPPLPLYIVAQQELRASRKLRVVYDGLADALVEFYK